MTATTSPLPPPMNHVFVDYENVHHVDLTLIGAKAVSFTLMVGKKQTRLDTDLVEKMLAHSASVHMVKLSSSGKNSLDFALAYYLGRAVLADPTAYFHIIAKDAGYDPLIEHLRERHINVRRHASCADLTFSWPGKTQAKEKLPTKKAVAKKIAKKAAKKVAAKKAPKKVAAKKVAKKSAAKKAISAQSWTERAEINFKEHPKARPAKRKTLLTKIGDLIGKPAEGPDVQAVLASLVNTGQLTFDEKDLPNYHL